MSALTDLFTALANKIRSKTGGQETYTPNEMVQDGIDDVYEAGVAAGTTTHTQTYTPSPNVAANDMGVEHEYRYVNTSGMIEPSGNIPLTQNGTGFDVSNYATASVAVPDPTLTGDATASDVKSGKTFYGSTLTKQTGTFAADAVNNSATATTSQATKSPASGKYFANFTINPQQHSETYTPAANKSNNDMGAVHNKRYVDTSGMVIPSGTYASGQTYTTNGSKSITGLANYTGVSFTVNVPSPTLSGDAAVGNVLSGKTFYNNSTTKRTGTMANNGAVSPSGLNCGGSYTIPEGYHNGSGVVTANSLASQTGVDSGKTAVTAGAMLSGYQGWVNGSKISGNISSKAAATYNTSASDQTITSGQYLSGTQTIKAVTTFGITADNIKDGVIVRVGDANSATRIANVTGTFTDASTVSSGQTAAAAAQIKSGYSAWVDGAEVKGSYVEPTITSITPSNTSPVSMTSGSNYSPTANGYAIQIYTSVTPTSSGAQFSQGMVKMSDGGYAYTEKPTKTRTTLWTNSAPTSNFSYQTISFGSKKITDYDYIEIVYRYSKTDSTSASTIFASSDLANTTTVDRLTFGMRSVATGSSAMTRARTVYADSVTSIYVQNSYQFTTSSQTASNQYVIPTYVYGIKYTGIS